MPVAVVTGASRGLGLALAGALVHDGWQVIVDARDGDALATAAGRLGGPGTITALPGDVTDPAHRRSLAGAVAALGSLDLIVNNASTLGPSPRPALADYPIRELDEVYRTNVIAPLALIQGLLALLSPTGTIVNVTSDASVEPYEGWGGYGSSKAALDQLTAILAAEHPELHVYAFDPGDMRTQMHQEAFPGEDISDRPDPSVVLPAMMRLIEGKRPSGRYRASDLAAAGAVAR